MFARRQVLIPFYRGFGRQRERAVGALAQDIGSTAIVFLREYVIAAEKRVSTDLLEIALPGTADAVLR